MKSKKRLFYIFADIPHKSWWCVCILQKDRLKLLTWAIKVMIDCEKNWTFKKKSDLNSQFLTHSFRQPQYGLVITVVDHWATVLYFLVLEKNCWAREVKWCCLTWGIYARFAKKKADSSQLIFSLTLTVGNCMRCYPR